MADEIYEERTRQKLSNSNNPRKVKGGKFTRTTVFVTMRYGEEREKLDSFSAKVSSGINIFVQLRFPLI